MKPKKDLNYIVGLEKAIAKKYGDIAVQNPTKFWDEEKEKEYIKQTKEAASVSEVSGAYQEKLDVGGFFVAKKLINRDVERTCPVCGVYSFKERDDVYMSKYECCYKCFVKHVERREERWLEGWRPKK